MEGMGRGWAQRLNRPRKDGIEGEMGWAKTNAAHKEMVAILRGRRRPYRVRAFTHSFFNH